MQGGRRGDEKGEGKEDEGERAEARRAMYSADQKRV